MKACYPARRAFLGACGVATTVFLTVATALLLAAATATARPLMVPETIASPTLAGGMTPPELPPVLFSPTSFWNTPLAPDQTLDPDSAQLVSNLVNQVALSGHAGVSTVNDTPAIWIPPAGTPGHRVLGTNDCVMTTDYNPVPAGPPSVPAPYWPCSQFPYSPSPYKWGKVPWSNGMFPSQGGDRNMVIYDPTTDTEFDFWGVTTLYPSPTAGVGGRLAIESSSDGVFPWPYGAASSGFALLGGLPLIREVQAGQINHVVAFNVPQLQCVQPPRAPATRNDCNNPGPYNLEEGLRFRLPPSYDIGVELATATPFVRMVATAAQRYGMIIANGSGRYQVTMRLENPDTCLPAESLQQCNYDPNNPWPALLGVAPHEMFKALDQFPWAALEALPPLGSTGVPAP
jgi:hypothetical protein